MRLCKIVALLTVCGIVGAIVMDQISRTNGRQRADLDWDSGHPMIRATRPGEISVRDDVCVRSEIDEVSGLPFRFVGGMELDVESVAYNRQIRQRLSQGKHRASDSYGAVTPDWLADQLTADGFQSISEYPCDVTESIRIWAPRHVGSVSSRVEIETPFGKRYCDHDIAQAVEYCTNCSKQVVVIRVKARSAAVFARDGRFLMEAHRISSGFKSVSP